MFGAYHGQCSVLDKSNLILFSRQACREETEVQKSSVTCPVVGGARNQA